MDDLSKKMASGEMLRRDRSFPSGPKGAVAGGPPRAEPASTSSTAATSTPGIGTSVSDPERWAESAKILMWAINNIITGEGTGEKSEMEGLGRHLDALEAGIPSLPKDARLQAQEDVGSMRGTLGILADLVEKGEIKTTPERKTGVMDDARQKIDSGEALHRERSLAIQRDTSPVSAASTPDVEVE
jgi:hypothetical protein